MTKEKDYDDDLPETAEVGSEGGSYSDAIVQDATRKGKLPRVERPVAAPSDTGQESEATNVVNDHPEDGVHMRRPDREP